MPGLFRTLQPVSPVSRRPVLILAISKNDTLIGI
jgi:hypothetical protein